MKTSFGTEKTGLWTGLYNHREKNQCDYIRQKVT